MLVGTRQLVGTSVRCKSNINKVRFSGEAVDRVSMQFFVIRMLAAFSGINVIPEYT